MKFSRSTFVLVLLNVAWLAALSWLIAQRTGPETSEARIEFVTNYVPIAKAEPSTVITNFIVASNDFRWAQLESEDYRDYVARLRSIGCPEQTIRDIVIADVDKLLAPKMQAASSQPKEINYWRPIEQELWEDTEQKEAFRQQRAVDFEKREVIRELLGVDLVGERLKVQGQDDYHGQRLGFLPEEKRARVRLALDQFSDRERMMLEQQIDEGNALTSSEELLRLRQEKDAALAQLLTSSEREEYDLWFSPTAAAIRDEVYGMNASQEEFLKLYQIRRNFTQQHGDLFGPDNPAWNEYQSQTRQALGEQRYAEFTRAQDSDYRELVRITARHKLNPEIAAQLYGYKQPAEEERARVEADPTLTPQQKAAGLQAIAQETQRAFKEMLGEKPFRQLMRRTANPWLQGVRRSSNAAVAGE